MATHPQVSFVSASVAIDVLYIVAETGHNKMINHFTLQTEICYDVDFAANGGVGGRCYDNLRCRQRQQVWHHDNFRVKCRTTTEYLLAKNMRIIIVLFDYICLGVYLGRFNHISF